ncbi:Cytochrome P460 [Desulfonatronum thiosulfatophilum]|uniref:Cytochrome P460 n=1 Tax=Desulfonatronum thiosulfatophilum TaxID=617002 RepID=A0A1G6ALA9_9BACT|nr:cytochrome P460 family protein [Desulfonatronum thiosulfatophilum]SDB08903.1 Cytochrome P460 [Desulfonatronum thiosulfatophilum]
MKAINGYRLAIGLMLAFFLIPALVWATEKSKEMPQAEGKDFLSYITEVNPYHDWELWPGTEKMYEGSEPHGVRLTTYVNEKALKGIEEGMLEEGMPDGSIIVKENYSAEEELINVTTMYKKEGFNPEAGDWFWIVHTADKQVENAGKIEMCISCHRQVEHRDYLFIEAHEQ